jgi:hypothetical protein
MQAVCSTVNGTALPLSGNFDCSGVNVIEYSYGDKITRENCDWRFHFITPSTRWPEDV